MRMNAHCACFENIAGMYIFFYEMKRFIDHKQSIKISSIY